MTPTIVKVGLGGFVVAAGGTGIWYWVSNQQVSLSQEKNYSTEYTGDVIGKKYGSYFLSSKYNTKQWNNIFEKYKSKFNPPVVQANANPAPSTKAKDKFGTVTEAYSTKATTALNQVCDAAYKETDSNKLVDAEPSDTQDTKFWKVNIWKYCSLGGIKTVDEDIGSYTGVDDINSKIGGDATNKKLFVSTKAKENDWFWEIRNKEFWGDTNGEKLKDVSKETNVF